MLSEFVGQADNKNKPIVGVCFGHQLIAKYFGGVVGNNEKGWMIGSFPLEIKKKFPWMKNKLDTTDLYHFNKERVTKLPEGAISFASTKDYPDFDQSQILEVAIKEAILIKYTDPIERELVKARAQETFGVTLT